MKFHYKVHKGEDGSYWAEGLELEGCDTQGNSLEELQLNLKEAQDLYLNEPVGTNMIFPLPDYSLESSPDTLAIEVDSRIAFALLVRQYRISHRLTQEQAQKAMGLPNRTSYARLESKGNPSLLTIDKIVKAFPDFPVQECFSR